MLPHKMPGASTLPDAKCPSHDLTCAPVAQRSSHSSWVRSNDTWRQDTRGSAICEQNSRRAQGPRCVSDLCSCCTVGMRIDLKHTANLYGTVIRLRHCCNTVACSQLQAHCVGARTLRKQPSSSVTMGMLTRPAKGPAAAGLAAARAMPAALRPPTAASHVEPVPAPAKRCTQQSADWPDDSTAQLAPWQDMHCRSKLCVLGCRRQTALAGCPGQCILTCCNACNTTSAPEQPLPWRARRCASSLSASGTYTGDMSLI